jgi:hypothetical protein
MAIAFSVGHYGSYLNSITSLGIATGTGDLATTMAWRESTAGDANQYGCGLGTDAIMGYVGAGVYYTLGHRMTVTTFGVGGITVVPDASINTCKMRMLVIG